MGASTPIVIELPGPSDIEDSDILAFTVERDIGQPDMAAIVLSNQEAKYSTKITIGQDCKIKVGDDKKEVFIGQVVGLEAHYKGGEKARLTIRCMNKMHDLLKKRKSLTFVDKKDEEILAAAAKDGKLSLDFQVKDSTLKSLKYKHVYQHNQTDLEFIRMRAGRIGLHVWCWDKKLFVHEPDLSQGPIANLAIGNASTQGAIKQFTPRMSSAAIVKKVTVKGWNPETKELIQGDYSIKKSGLGKEDASAGSGKLGNEETFTVDHPIWGPDEAKALAKARLTDLALSYITGECELTGDPKMDLAKVVEIKASEEADSGKDPFNGNYYIMGVTHRYSLTKTKDGGYVTILRLARDAQKG